MDADEVCRACADIARSLVSSTENALSCCIACSSCARVHSAAICDLASVPNGLAPTGLALRRVLRNLFLGSRNQDKLLPESIGLLLVFVSLIFESIHSET